MPLSDCDTVMDSAAYGHTLHDLDDFLFIAGKVFGFHDIRLPKNGRRVCSFIYICCVIRSGYDAGTSKLGNEVGEMAKVLDWVDYKFGIPDGSSRCVPITNSAVGAFGRLSDYN